jgi:hypothetical protein
MLYRKQGAIKPAVWLKPACCLIRLQGRLETESGPAVQRDRSAEYDVVHTRTSKVEVSQSKRDCQLELSEMG